MKEFHEEILLNSILSIVEETEKEIKNSRWVVDKAKAAFRGLQLIKREVLDAKQKYR